eukprot:9174605-Alexandrium_andersonii.AAC.1
MLYFLGFGGSDPDCVAGSGISTESAGEWAGRVLRGDGTHIISMCSKAKFRRRPHFWRNGLRFA